jgi:3-phytase
VTSFAVGANDFIDAVTDTDGIDISTISINSFFPSGIVVVQDGFNEGDQIENTQNFKFISAKEVLKAINLK